MPPRIHLGINTCFAAKRWPEPQQWVGIVTEDLALKCCQVSLDLAGPGLERVATCSYAEAVRCEAESAGLHLHSTFTGLVAYTANLLLDPQPSMREAASRWFERAVDFTAEVGAPGTGGFIGALSVADARVPGCREALVAELGDRLNRLARYAATRGLAFLMVENMAGMREFGHSIAEAHELEQITADAELPWVLCLDVGHPAALRRGDSSDDPIAWLRETWRHPPVLHLQQANRDGDHHWPFTSRHNAIGLVDRDAVLAAVSGWAVDDVYMFMEVIHAAEADDAQVLADLRESVAYWRESLHALPGQATA